MPQCINDKHSHGNSENRTNNGRYLKNGAKYKESCYYSLIGSHIWVFHYYQTY